MRRISTLLLTAGFAILGLGLQLQGCDGGAVDPDQLRKAARTAMLDREYHAAAELWEEAYGAEQRAADQARAIRALVLAEDWSSVRARVDPFLAAHPDAHEVGEVRFYAARAAVEAGRMERAATLVSDQLAWLENPDFRGWVGAELLKRADAAYRGRVVGEGPFARRLDPDWAEAAHFYDAALEATVPAALEARVRQRLARSLHESGAHVHAASLCTELLGRAELPEASRREIEALRVRARLAHGDLARAARGLSGVRMRAPDHPELPQLFAALLELAEAAWARDRAAALRRTLLETWPESEQARAAAYRRAALAVEREDWSEAAAAYRFALERYGDAGRAVDARLGLARVEMKRRDFDAAARAYRAFLELHRESPAWQEGRKELDELGWVEGLHHLEEGELDAARRAFDRHLEAQPASLHAAGILYRLAEARRENEEWDAALDHYARLLRRHPEDRLAPAAQLAVAKIFEEALVDAGRAVREYRVLLEQHPESDPAGAARKALARMKSPSLSVTTPRVFRSDEAARLTIRSRNVEELELRGYRIDLEAYFRSQQSLRQVETVMVDVLEPDFRMLAEVGEDQPYRELEREVGLELPEDAEDFPASYLVVVEGGGLRATTLVIRSDIGLITKRAPRELLALVIDTGTGAPRAGAQVLVHSGGELLSASTGADGVARLAVSGEGDVDVLARTARGVAATSFGANRARGRSRSVRVHLATDRPLYRPGDTVQIRALVREPVEGALRTPDGEALGLQVLDARGHALLDSEQPLDAFGSATARFTLPEHAPPQHSYRILAHFDGTVTDRGLAVRAFRKPDLFLELAPSRAAVLPGEPVEVTVIARQPSGEPVAGLPVRVVASAGQPLLERIVRTGEDGRARVGLEDHPVLSLPSTDATVIWRAEAEDLAHRLVEASARVRVTPAGFEAALRLAPQEVPSGRGFVALLRTRDHDGEPVARSGRLTLLRRRPGRRDQELWTLEAATDASGAAEVALHAPEQPGVHLLRWTGADRGGNRVVAQAVLTVRAPERAPAIVLRADDSTLEVGATARLGIETPGTARTLLLTFEAEEILDHRVVRLDGRSTSVAFEVAERFAPNVWVRAAAPRLGADSRTLATGELAFEVRSRLAIEIEPEQEMLRPGARTRVRVRARDAQGRPVAAQVALSVVDEGIFLLEPERAAPLARFFMPPRRADRVDLDSSFAWKFARFASAVDPALIAYRESRASKTEPKPEILLVEEPVLQEPGFDKDAWSDEKSWNNSIGVGGGAGGKYGARGGRGGGRRGGSPTGSSSQERAPRSRFRDTAHFEVVRTDASTGEAWVSFTLPDDLTTWRIRAQGATRGSRFGDAVARIEARQPVAADLVAPRFLREGDEAVATAIAWNHHGEATGLAMRAGASGAAEGIRVGGVSHWRRGDRRTLGLELRATRLGSAELGLQVSDAMHEDAVERTLPVLPRGTPRRFGASGRLDGEASVPFAIPAAARAGSASLELRIDPGLDRVLVAGLQELRTFPYACVEQTVNRFWPAAAAARARSRLDLAPRELGDAVRRGVLRLGSLQNEDGSWGWWRDAPADPLMTAYALAGLGAAQRAGFEVSEEMISLGVAHARGVLAEPAGDRAEAQAFLAYSLSLCGFESLELVAPLYRERDRLGPRGLAQLALALRAAGAEPQAEQVLELLAERWSAQPEASVEDLGFSLLAVARLRPEHPLLPWLQDRLLERRRGAGFGSTRATGAALLGLAESMAARNLGRTEGEVEIWLGARRLATVVVTAGRSSLWSMPAEELAPGARGHLRLVPRGGIRPGYTVNGSYRVAHPAEDARGSDALSVGRSYRYVVPDYDELRATGWDDGILRDPMASGTQGEGLAPIGPGDRVLVTLDLRAGADLRYVLVEEPLPAGFELAGAPEGAFTHWQLRDDRLAFFLEHLPGGQRTPIRYELRAVWPGRYAVPSTQAWPMYHPELDAVARATALRVEGADVEIERAPGAGLSPGTLLARAEAAQRGGDRAEARAFAQRLLDGPPLLDSAARRAHLVLARVAGREDPHAVVRHAGAARALDPLRPLPDADAERLARAWYAAGHWEEAYHGLLRVVGERYRRDRAVLRAFEEGPGATADLDRIAFLDGLVRAYPQDALVEADHVRIAEWLAREAESASEAGEEEARQQERFEELRDVIAGMPGSPAAPRLERLLHQVLRRAAAFDRLVIEASMFGRRHPRSEQRDGADYDHATALFALERYRKAIEVAEHALATEYPRKGEDAVASRYRLNLLHLQAQSWHALGELERAVPLYEQLREHSYEAAETLRALERRELEASAVVRVASNGTPVIRVARRNLPEVRVRAYAVDLLAYLALRKDLAEVAGMKLDGMPATLRDRLAAPPGDPRARAEEDYPLEGLDPGVYVVIFEADRLRATSLVLKSDLEVTLMQGRLGPRGQVTDRHSGEPVRGAVVRIGGSAGLIGTTTTDARGIYEIRSSGTAGSAVAAFEDQVAFARRIP